MILKSKQRTQSVVLLLSTALNIFVGLAVNYYLTKILSKEEYGNYALMINILEMGQVIVNFGFYQSICRLVAITEDVKKSREYYFAGIIITVVLYLIFVIGLLFYINISTSIKENNMQGMMYLTIPFAWIFLLITYNELYLQGDNKIGLMALGRLGPRAIYLLFLILAYFFIDAGQYTIVVLYMIPYIIVFAIITYFIRLSKTNLRERLYEIWEANKSFGFNIYVGALVATGSATLSGILISHFEDTNVSVGYFSIATRLCTPLSLLPNILATVYFKKMASSRNISSRLQLSMFFLNVLCFVGVYVVSGPLILVIFGEDYAPATSIIQVLAIGYLLYGMSDFYNRFLLSKGRGKELRNTSFAIGFVLVVSNYFLVKYFGAMGAAYARIVSGFLYFIIMYFTYRVIVSKYVD